MKIGRLTLSDRAARGVYADLSGPEIDSILANAFADASPEITSRILEDHQPDISAALIEMADFERCSLIVTTGGTGPGKRDVTPEATCAVVEKELPGFGEIMRMQSFSAVPTAILSRSIAGIRGTTLIVNLPGNPQAIGECLPLLLPAIQECIKHLNQA
ncbi:MAG: molybdopterin adenylyltransferase [Verrucomicrobiota bacterium]